MSQFGIKHAPWGTPAPPVTTVAWTQADWDRYAERYRPEWYKGSIRDYDAYEKARAAWNEEYRKDLIRSFGVEPEELDDDA